MNQRARRKSRSFCFTPTDKSKTIPINRIFIIYNLSYYIFQKKFTIRMKKHFLILIITCGYLLSNAQAPSIQWQKTVGGSDRDFFAYNFKNNQVAQTTDNGFIIAGTTYSTDGDGVGNHGGPRDILLYKTDINGSILWKKVLGGGGYDEAQDLLINPDGSFFLLSTTNSTNGDIVGQHGDYDYWLIKFDANGNILWKKMYGGTGKDYPERLLKTADGNLLMFGISSSIDGDVIGLHTTQDMWAVKINITNGNIIWNKCYGGSGVEDYQNIELLPSGGFIFVCTTTSNNNGDITGYHPSGTATITNDSWIVKIDETGTIVWQKCYGGSGDEYTLGILVIPTGGFLITNVTFSNNNGDVTNYHGGGDIWVVFLNATGNIIWKKTLGGTALEDIDERFKNIVQLSDGNFVIMGLVNSNDGDASGNHGGQDIWIVKLNGSTGAIIWQKCLGGALADGGYFMNLYRYSNDDVLVSASTLSTNGDVIGNHGASDGWLVRLNNSNGSVSWQKCFGGTKDDFYNEIIPTGDGSWLILGSTYSIDGDVVGKHGTTADDDMWVVKLSTETIPCAVTHSIANRNSGVTLSYKASDNIKAYNLIESVTSPTTNITYQAAKSILLNPGFEAKKGSVFTSKIATCN